MMSDKEVNDRVLAMDMDHLTEDDYKWLHVMRTEATIRACEDFLRKSGKLV